MNYPAALRALGLPCRSKVKAARTAWKEQTVAAHRQDNPEQLRLLSQVKQAIKRRTMGTCQTCGVHVAQSSTFCAMHYQFHRSNGKRRIPMAVEPVLYKIQSGVLITQQRKPPSPLRAALEALAKAKVGDSFQAWMRGNGEAVRIAKQLGIGVVSRKMYPPKSHPHRKEYFLYTIWRTDAFKPDEVNDLINRIRE